LRTLPNNHLFLLLNIALVALGLAPGLLNANTAAYFVFLQNLWKQLGLFFWESWSLAVEEWFYLLFPPLVALFA
jgi:peptidoglycan/LPS O-acetylase OafA/YrhL